MREASGGQDDGAVHLGQLGEALGGVLRIEQEASGADREDGRVVADDDQCPVLGLKDSVQSLPELGARGNHGQRLVQRLAAAEVGHPGIVSGPLRGPAGPQVAQLSASASVRTPTILMPRWDVVAEAVD